MRGLARPMLRAHARAHLALAALVVVATALIGGTLGVLVGAARARGAAGATQTEAALGAAAVSVAGWTLALTIFTGIFLVASMTAFTVDARSAETATLRLAGATGRQMARSVRVEAVVVGLLASAVGAACAWPAGAVLRRLLVGAGFAPTGLHVEPPAWAVAVAVVLGTVVTVVGASAAARRAARTDPLVAVTAIVPTRRAMSIGRWAACAGGVLGMVALLGVRSTTRDEVVAVVLLMCLTSTATLASVAPLLVPAVVRVLGAPLVRWAPGVGLLAVRHARYAAHRTASLALPVLLVLGLTGGLVTVIGSVNRGPGTQRTTADLVVLGTGLVPADVPGVAAVTPMETFALTAIGPADEDGDRDEEGWTLTAIDLDAAVPAGLVAFRDDAVGATGVPIASTDAVALPLGTTLDVTSGDGPSVLLTVTRVVTVDAVVEGDALIDPALLGRWAEPTGGQTVVQVAGGIAPATVRERLGRAVAPAEVVVGADLVRQRTDAQDRRNRDAVVAILGGGIAMACCSIVLGGLSGSADRRREIEVLVRSGATRRQIRAVVVVETVVVLAVAALLAGVDLAWVVGRTGALVPAEGVVIVPVGLLSTMLAGAAVLALGATLAGTGWQLRRGVRG